MVKISNRAKNVLMSIGFLVLFIIALLIASSSYTDYTSNQEERSKYLWETYDILGEAKEAEDMEYKLRKVDEATFVYSQGEGYSRETLEKIESLEKWDESAEAMNHFIEEAREEVKGHNVPFLGYSIEGVFQGFFLAVTTFFSIIFCFIGTFFFWDMDNKDLYAITTGICYLLMLTFWVIPMLPSILSSVGLAL